MTATLEHAAAVKRQNKTHAALARRLGRDDLAARFEPPMSELYARLVSLSQTQRRLAAQYEAEARKGGPWSERDRSEAKRLREEARWYADRARRERAHILERAR